MTNQHFGCCSLANQEKSRKIGVLLVNLGTPVSYNPSDVYSYLIEFLTDPRVIDSPWLLRQLLVRGVIVPFRYKQSAKSYEAIWTKEGSPLMVYGKSVKKLLQEQMGSSFYVELAMRYQKPSLKEGIHALINKNVDEILVAPLFPQYASATTGSIHQKVMKIVKDLQTIPKILFLDQFATHPAFIKAFVENGKRYDLNSYDQILFSFHGLPQRQLKKADRHGGCLQKNSCCETLNEKNKTCYSAQCYATAFRIAEGLKIARSHYTICFQSRLGKDPWLQPYASEVIHNLASKGAKRILVFCPSFVCDCLETLYEFKVEYANEFKALGGEQLDLVEGLNDEPHWIDALKEIIVDSYSNIKL